MDKKEYNLKLEEIDKYVNQGNYSEAAKIADEVDWRRVRNVRTLCMISEIYEADNRYEDSKELLMRAYRRSPVGRSILYRLVEVTIQLKQFDEAIEFYSEYVQAAPHDNSRYILKYKIYRGRGSSLEEQIDILKEYLDQEYNEKWAYELAKLYQQAGKIQECLAACDDLVLWFHSGKYVIKALELKRRYATLTPKQQEIYDRRMDEPEDDDVYADEEALGKEKQIVDTNEDALAETIMADTEKEIAKAVAETARQAQAEDAGEPESAQDDEIESGTEDVSHMDPEETAGSEREPDDSDSAGEPEDGDEDDLDEPEKDGWEDDEEPWDGVDEETSHEAAQSPEPAEERDLQADLIKSMREIVYGVNRKPEPDPDEEMADQVIERSKEEQETAREKEISLQMPKMQMPENGRKNTAAKLSIDDILLSMGEKGDAIRQAAARASREMQNPNRPAGVVSAMDEALMNMGVDLEAAQRTQPKEPKVQPSQKQEAPETEDIILAKTRRIPTEEIAEIHASYGMDKKEEFPDFDELEDAPAAQASEDAGAKAEAKAPEETETPAPVQEQPREASRPRRRRREQEPEREPQAQAASGQAAPVEGGRRQGEPGQAAPRTESGNQGAPGQAAPVEETRGRGVSGQAAPRTESADRSRRMSRRQPEQTATGAQGAPAGTMPQGDRPEAQTRRKTQEMPRRRVYTGPRLKEYQKGLFPGFLDIQNLEAQIASAISLAEQKGEDRTSRTGNILIFGDHGCGKTTIATGIAKAIAQDKGSQFLKMAKIYAADLNRKDIAATIAKIAGGVLIVEEAGDLEDAIVDQLTTAMEFRTDGLIVILEDEQRYIHDLLMRHPRFTMKFTSQIFIPTFTIDELVRFGEIYAGNNDYVFSEGAAAALYDRISAVSAQGDAVSITNVIELVDRAIRKANKFFRKMGSGKKRYDGNDCVILQEKDFK